MGINLSVPAAQELKPRIVVFGVGGAGGNAVNNMITAALEGVEFVVANTDAQALASSLADRRIQLGTSLTQGLGAGARPDVGKAAAEEAMEQILGHLQGCHMAFITAGMGGGTGTGAAPVIARAARELNILTVGVVTKPFQFEGTHRLRMAEGGIDELQQYVDTLIIIPNQNLFRIANEKTTFADAFKMADNVLHSGVRGVTDLMVMPGLINLDFADVRTVMSEMGKAMMGTGEAEGANRALEAADAAIANPLLDDVSMRGARGVLINITGGFDLTLYEVDEAANRIRSEVDPDANIIVGSTFDEGLAGKMRVSVVATGIDAQLEAPQQGRPSAVVTPMVRSSTGRSSAPAPAAYAPPPAPVAAMPQPAEEMDEAAAPAAEAFEPQPPVPAEPAARPVLRTAIGRDAPFIPPKPMEAPVRRDPLRSPDPFREAAVVNAGREDRGERRLSLFERMTGRVRAGDPASRHEPAAQRQAPAAPAVQPAPAAPVRAVAKAPSLGGLDPADRLAPQREEDLLDIPAFLRRQAN